MILNHNAVYTALFPKREKKPSNLPAKRKENQSKNYFYSLFVFKNENKSKQMQFYVSVEVVVRSTKWFDWEGKESVETILMII